MATREGQGAGRVHFARVLRAGRVVFSGIRLGTSLFSLSVAFLLPASLLLAFVTSCSDRPEPRRNLILISMDTLRADRLGAYGYDRPTSPNIDALAARGARFARTYSSAPWTLPAHASIFTGLTPQRHDALGWLQKLPESVPTLPELLQQAGWRTYGPPRPGDSLAGVTGFPGASRSTLTSWVGSR